MPAHGARSAPLDQGVTRIRQQLFRVSGRLHLGPVKTAAGRCDLPLPGIAREALSRQAGLRVIGATSHEWTARGLVFTTRTGRPVEPWNLARSFERITTAAGLRAIRLHDLRHTTATFSRIWVSHGETLWTFSATPA